jgi:peptide/nickel transport system permease protein
MSATSTSPSGVISVLQTQDSERRSESLLTKGLRRLRNDRLSMICIVIVTIFALLAVFAPFISNTILRVDPNETDALNNFLPIFTPGHILGTDNLGRDQLSRLLYAGGVTLGIGFFGAVMSLTIGMLIGVITGYFGGAVDDFVNWIITTLDSIPSLYLLILISAIFRPTAEALVFVIALTGWTGVTRLIRGQTFSIRNLDYITSARALGASSLRIMLLHIIPNLVSITAIVLMRGIGNLMLAEAGLSFLGLGVQPPQATWGNMLTNAQQYIVNPQGTHLIFPPGLAIWITVLCLYIIGDGIRDAFDPAAKE